MRGYLLGLSAGVMLLGGMPMAAAAEEKGGDEHLLKQAGIATDGAGLIAFFRQRTTDVADEERIKELVRQLGDDKFKVREKASRQLVTLGPRAKPYLEAAKNNPDPEIARRAQECLQRIGEGATAATISAAVRVLARHKPPEAAAVLLGYLPTADDESIAESIRHSLETLAVRDGKAEPALLAALDDKSAVRRAAAAAALGRGRAPDVMTQVHKLLKDRDPQVRLRVGLALAAVREKEAIPTLIRLIDELPVEQTGLVLSLLHRLAGDSAPTAPPAPEQAARRKCRDAWETWWKDHQARLEPARLEQESRTLGYTLVVLLDLGIIERLDTANQVRWKLDGIEKPLDVQLLPGEERVLIAEHEANRVSERNLKGEVVWKHTVTGPLAAQRLSNGNTFITTQTQLLEVNKNGKEVFSYSRPDGGLFMRATKLRSGDIACVISLGLQQRFVRLTPMERGVKEVKSWGVQVHTSGGHLDVLPNGHVLIPEMNNNRVVEYDADGRNVWEVAVDQPIAAARLANGNTLITLMRQKSAIEVDRAGKEVWQFKVEGSRVTRAYRR